MGFSDDRYYRPDEIAKILAISKCQVYRMIKSVEDPLYAVRINTHLRVHGKVLNAYLEAHKTDSLELGR